MLGSEEIDKERDIEKDRRTLSVLATWMVRAGGKYIASRPCGLSNSDVSAAIRNVVRHDTRSSNRLDRVSRATKGWTR